MLNNLMNKVKLRTKLMSGYAIILVLVSIMSLVVFKDLEVLMESVNWVNHTHEVIEEISIIEKSIVDMETGLRAFMLTGEERFLEPYDSGIKVFNSNIILVSELTSDNPNQVIRFEQINSEKISWNQNYVLPQIAERRRINSLIGTDEYTAEFSKMIAPVLRGVGKDYVDGIRFVLKEAVEEENSLIIPRLAEQESSINATNNILVSGTLLSIFLGIIISFIITLNISKQLGGEVSQVVELAERLEKGDFTYQFNINENDKTSALAKLSVMTVSLKEVVGNIRNSAKTISITAQQLASSSQQAGVSSQEVSQAIQNIATGSEQLSNQVSGVSKSAKELSEESAKASVSAGEASAKMEDIAASVKQSSDSVLVLDKKNKEIVQIVDTINNIATQTNLLALNAAIEAARAGEAGRGFAVVAEKVRELADESQGATKNIEELIGSMRENTETVVSSMSKGSAKIEESGQIISLALDSFKVISTKIESIESTFEQVTAVAQQSSSSSQQMSAGVQQTNAVIQQVSSAAQELSKVAEAMDKIVTKFKLSEADSTQVLATKVNSSPPITPTKPIPEKIATSAPVVENQQQKIQS